MIRATAYSDCRGIEISFDAAKWAEQATDQALIDLGACGFRGDYPADDVVMYMADSGDAEAVKLFEFIKLVPRQPWNGDTNGFECEVDEDDLRVWLTATRPHLVAAVFAGVAGNVLGIAGATTTKTYDVIISRTLEDSFRYSVQANDEVHAAKLAHMQWDRDASSACPAAAAAYVDDDELSRTYEVHDLAADELHMLDRLDVWEEGEVDPEYRRKAGDVGDTVAAADNATLLAEDIVKRIDGPLFRRQRSLIYALETALFGKLSAAQLEDLSGISNLLEVIADTAHDVYGMATLMQANDDLYQSSDFPDLLDRK